MKLPPPNQQLPGDQLEERQTLMRAQRAIVRHDPSDHVLLATLEASAR